MAEHRSTYGVVRRLHHVSLSIPDHTQEQVRTFYGNVLGLNEKPTPESVQDVHAVWYMLGDAGQELHLIPDTILPRAEAQNHFCIDVDNLDIYQEKLLNAGYEVLHPTPVPNRPRFFCLDPFGNRIEFTTITGPYYETFI
jgi:catechol 2,3-dioxygenase-like lactoylglutathione lyase family enzyme